jgi:heptosyltransferase-1/heptosyltransferase-2
MAQMDVLVLATTAHEAFGRVIIEAQAAGVPVVATRMGGVVDIIEDDRNGLLVAPADPQGMSEAVLKIFKDKEFARRLAENAYQKVQEKYSVGLMTAQTLDVYQEALSNFRALVIKLSSLGDVILSSAALRSIREKFPKGWRISALVGEESRDVLLGCPYIDELIVCDLKNKDRGLKGLLKTGSALRKRNFDLVVDLQNNRKSHILSYLTLAPDRYGYRNKKFGFLLNHSIQDDCIALEPVKHQFRVLGMLGIELKDPRLELWPSQDDADYVKELFASEWLSTQQKIIGINLSASRRWQTKAWPMGHIIKLCEELGRRDLRVVLTGTGQDVTAAQDLTQKVKGTKLINACGKTTINQLACLIRECSAYVSSDSAPLHVAAAAGVPFVALFGPTDPSRHLFPAKNFILLKKGLKCGPCYKPKCKNKRCMELISPQEVLEAIDRLLK